jgi:glycosyltransferase involved in cell wall biosynthesis
LLEKMMKLGVNGWRIHGQRTGVGRYLLNVVKHWTVDRVSGRFAEINFYTPKPVDRNEIPLPENIRERVLASRRSMLVWENLQFGPGANENVLFCPSYTRPLVARGRTVVVTHDATSQLYPQLFPASVRLFYNRVYRWSARHAVLIITDSEAARQDIARCWGVPLERIRVIYLAPAEIFRPVADESQINEIRHRYFGSSEPFLLFVGKLSGRRNIPRLLQAFSEFKRRTSLPHKLLLIGLNIHNMDLLPLVAELGLADDLKHYAYVSDEDLNLLYNAAEIFISPSEYETISLPVMEAQATETPVICINTAGMREITGGAALLISKLEVREMAEAMVRLAGDAALRRELAEKGSINARRFSWQRCAADTLTVLAEAANLPLPSIRLSAVGDLR